MPTITEVTKSNLIIRISGNLKPHQQPERRLYAVPEVIDWMKSKLPIAKSDNFTADAGRPIEQVLYLANKFVAGEDLPIPLPHSMTPEHLGIYRIRTPDIRMDGWFPEKFCFIIGAMELKSLCVKTPGLDDQQRDKAIAERIRLQINDGNFLMGDYNDHI